MNTKRLYFWISLTLLLLGVTLGGLFVVLDLGGFFGGMCAGAGVMFMVLAAYIYGRYVLRDQGQDDDVASDGWLPSRDREGQS